MRRRWIPALFVLVVLAPDPAELRAQQLGAGAPPIGVRLNLIDRSYDIVARTGQEIYDQLQANGWTRYYLVYSWRYSAERLTLMNGNPSDRCRPFDFDFIYDVEVTYPRWRPPEGANPALVEAWEAFSEELVAQWEQYREGIVERGRDAARRFRRYEESCVFLNQRVREQVEESFEGEDPIRQSQPLLGLRWPPDGHEHVMRAAPADPPRAEARTASANDPRDEPRADPAPPASPAPPPLPPAVTPAPTIDVAVAADLADGATGLVVDLHHRGSPQFHEAFGARAPGGSAPLTPEESFGFVAFTEVLVAALAHNLAAGDAFDLDAPIATWRPELTPGLGRVTARQLLQHRAGLDNAMPRDSTAEWSQVMAALDDRALFTRPGAIYSYSRYSYPLLVETLEAVGGAPVEQSIQGRVLAPLGMTSTRLGARDAPDARDGLPGAVTSTADVRRFWEGWIDGALPGWGRSSLERTEPDPHALGARTFGGGVWIDRVGERLRVSLMCGSARSGWAAGFQVLPDTRTIMTYWARYDLSTRAGPALPPSPDRWPGESVRYILAAIAGALDTGEEIYRPTLLSGGAEAGNAPRRCAEPAVSERRVEEFGERTAPGEWAGRYVNGDWFFELQAVDGRLVTPADPSMGPYTIRHYGGDVYFTDIDRPDAPHVGFPLRLVRDSEERRYVILGDRAYLHEDDRPGR